MKKKLLRSAFCVLLCVAVLMCGCVNAFGLELFEYEFGIGTAYFWNGRTSQTVISYWLNLDIPAATTGLCPSNLNEGVRVWTSGLADVTPRFTSIYVELSNWPSTHWIAFSIPTLDFYSSMMAGVTDWEGGAATTVPYSVDGIAIDKTFRIDRYEPEIAYALVYFNPLQTSSTDNNWTNTVAHELGHCFGFGHNGNSDSIMKARNTNIITLPLVDKEDFEAKYGSGN